MSDFTVEIEREDDGRWIGEVVDLPGVLAYGENREAAVAKAKAPTCSRGANAATVAPRRLRHVRATCR